MIKNIGIVILGILFCVGVPAWLLGFAIWEIKKGYIISGIVCILGFIGMVLVIVGTIIEKI